MTDEALAENADVETSDQLTQHNHMLSNSILFGRIVEKTADDPEQPTTYACVLVHIGGIEKNSFTRNWMRWTSARSGYDAEWWQPEIDEQVLVLAPSGNLNLALIVGVIPRGQWLNFPEKNDFSAAAKPEQKIPALDKAHQHIRRYKDGTTSTYDRDTHSFALSLKEKPEEDPGIDTLLALKEKNGQLSIKFGDASSPKTSIELSTENGIKLSVGENFIEIKEDAITIKSKTLSLDISDDITGKSKKITLDGGSKIVIDSSAVDVS